MEHKQGTYDEECQQVTVLTEAKACLLVVLGGVKGNGVSYSAQQHVPLSLIIHVLESLLVEMKLDAERIYAASGDDAPFRSVFLAECEYAAPLGAFQEKKKQKVLISVLDSYSAQFSDNEFDEMLTEMLDKYIQQKFTGATFIRKLYHKATDEHVRYSFPGVETQPDMALVAYDETTQPTHATITA